MCQKMIPDDGNAENKKKMKINTSLKASYLYTIKKEKC